MCWFQVCFIQWFPLAATVNESTGPACRCFLCGSLLSLPKTVCSSQRDLAWFSFISSRPGQCRSHDQCQTSEGSRIANEADGGKTNWIPCALNTAHLGSSLTTAMDGVSNCFSESDGCRLYQAGMKFIGVSWKNSLAAAVF